MIFLKQLIFLIIIAFFISCKSSVTNIGEKNANYIPYYLKVYEADSLYLVNDYLKSYKILDSLFKKYEPINIEGYREFETYIATAYLSGNYKHLDKNLKRSFKIHGTTYEILKNDSILIKVFEKSKFKTEDLALFSRLYKRKLNLDLRDSVVNMVKRDFEAREKKLVINKELSLINEENSNALRSIFEKYGYPGVKKIGYYHLDQRYINLGPIFLHCSQAFTNDYLLKNLLEYATRGECSPDLYAARLDKSLLGNDEGKQLYGTFNKTAKELMPLISPKKLDSLRKSMGLPHRDYQKWRLKAKFNYEY